MVIQNPIVLRAVELYKELKSIEVYTFYLEENLLKELKGKKKEDYEKYVVIYKNKSPNAKIFKDEVKDLIQGLDELVLGNLSIEEELQIIFDIREDIKTGLSVIDENSIKTYLD